MLDKEKQEKKQAHLTEMAEALSSWTGDEISLLMDKHEMVYGTYNGKAFEYSVWGDSNRGMTFDTLRALSREGFIRL